MRWIIPGFVVGYVLLFAACWVPLLYGWIDNLFLVGMLGILSGVPLCLAFPFIISRVYDGYWPWEA